MAAKRVKGLYARVKGDVTYYSFRHPTTGKEIGVGTDRAAAIQAAQLVSSRLAPQPVQQLLNKIERPRSTWAEHVKWFRHEHLVARRRKTGAALSPATLAVYDASLSKPIKWNDRAIDSITRHECVELIEAQPGRMGQVLRAHLIQIFQAAIARGLRDDNPAEGTLRPDAVIQRARLTEAGYNAIWKKAPPWLQRAMTLSLLSLQRPTDLCRLTRDCWDAKKKTWRVRQSKSEGAGYGLYVFKPHAELASAIKDCHKNPVEDCDRLIAYEPQRKKDAKDREHWAELSDEILARRFASIRDDLKHKDLHPDGMNPPSYYEIKSLGVRMYEEAGRSPEWIQSLLGHQDIATSKIYGGRHKEKWIEVEL